ncbi:MAG: prefoldin subunit alpha [Candidatus Anstonellales archaeon]
MVEKGERQDSVDSVRLAQQIEIYRQQLQALIQQATGLEAVETEMMAAKETLESAEGKDDLLLIPIGGGVFVRGKRKKGDNVLLNIGAGLVVEKTQEEALEALERRINENKRLKEIVRKTIEETSEKLEKAEMEFRRVAGEIGKDVQPPQK